MGVPWAAITERRRAGALCVALGCLFLVVGWWPFSPFPPNRVSWAAGGRGLSFQPDGVAYVEAPLPAAAVDHTRGITIELVLEARGDRTRGVSHILAIDDGRVPWTLALCQWKSELLLRIPASTTRRGFREDGIEALQPRRRRVVVISGDASGTSFYLDGQLARQAPGFVVPHNALDGRLIVGSAATGQQTWPGTLYGLAIFSRAVDADEAAAHQALWLNGEVARLADAPGLVALYPLTDGTGAVAVDRSANQRPLVIPERYQVLRKRVLEFPGIALPIGPSMFGDVVLNLLGFVPLGCLAFWYFRDTASSSWPPSLLATLVGAGVSLTIELGQVWLPTRSSTSADLACNTIGALVGAAVARWLRRFATAG